jgi:tripartite-type tricarboxylate transporter receptor subunit TctC
MDRRHFVLSTLSTAATALAVGPAFAQEAYPSHAITIINAFPPGGINDIVTRPLATILEPILKQPVVVETKAGAAGQIGAQVAAAAKPDGYTLLSHNTGISGYAEVDKLFGRPAKTTRADFIPLARLIADPVLLLVNDQQPYKTLKDFIDDAKANPGKLVFSSGGLYGASHLPLAYLEKATGPLKLPHLPTSGGGPAITAILGNNAQVTTQSVSATLPHVKSGKLRPLAVFSATRSKLLPDVPTLKELGYDVEYYLWVGIFAPKATPPAIVTTSMASGPTRR